MASRLRKLPQRSKKGEKRVNRRPRRLRRNCPGNASVKRNVGTEKIEFLGARRCARVCGPEGSAAGRQDHGEAKCRETKNKIAITITTRAELQKGRENVALAVGGVSCRC